MFNPTNMKEDEDTMFYLDNWPLIEASRLQTKHKIKAKL